MGSGVGPPRSRERLQAAAAICGVFWVGAVVGPMQGGGDVSGRYVANVTVFLLVMGAAIVLAGDRTLFSSSRGRRGSSMTWEGIGQLLLALFAIGGVFALFAAINLFM